MRIAIDASNLRSGGGVTHLNEILRQAHATRHEFSAITVYAGARTLAQLPPPTESIRYQRVALLDRPLPFRIFWWHFVLPRLVKKTADVLLAPGGLAAKTSIPVVTMSRNMLPFEVKERRRFGLGWMRLKLWLIRRGQIASFKRADGLIFLSAYAREVVTAQIPAMTTRVCTIPHGINERFFADRSNVADAVATADKNELPKPVRILYVSSLHPYKHHDVVVAACARLVEKGHRIELQLAGGGAASAVRGLTRLVRTTLVDGLTVRFWGKMPFKNLHSLYSAADVFVFASSCENMPNTLLEAMASGLPIACSNAGPMPEVLGDAGVYFDPEHPGEIAEAVEKLLGDLELRHRLAALATERAGRYSWEACADETFRFVRTVVKNTRV